VTAVVAAAAAAMAAAAVAAAAAAAAAAAVLCCALAAVVPCGQAAALLCAGSWEVMASGWTGRRRAYATEAAWRQQQCMRVPHGLHVLRTGGGAARLSSRCAPRVGTCSGC
jgi:hypothetical protein